MSSKFEVSAKLALISALWEEDWKDDELDDLEVVRSGMELGEVSVAVAMALSFFPPPFKENGTQNKPRFASRGSLVKIVYKQSQYVVCWANRVNDWAETASGRPQVNFHRNV